LPSKNPAGDRPARGADTPIADNWLEGIGAASRRAMLDKMANNRDFAEMSRMEEELALRALQNGSDEVRRAMREPFEETSRVTEITDEEIANSFSRGRGNETADNAEIMDMIYADAQENPQAYEGLPSSREELEGRVQDMLQEEYRDLLAIEQTVPEERRFLTSLIGGFYGEFRDLRNLPWMAFGGGGGVLRTMGREAALNVAAETTQLPSRFRSTELLETPDPNVASELALAGVFGGAFGGIAAGGAKAADFLRTRNTTPRVTGDPITDQQLAGTAEEAVVTGEDPLAAVQRDMEAMPQQQTPPPGRDPLILRPEERRTPVDPEIDAQIADLQAEVDRMRAEVDYRQANPLIDRLRRGDVDPQSGRRMPSGLQVHPEGSAADALRAADINARSFPGLFSRKGRKEYDNLVASEWKEMFPGIIDATGTRYGDDYLDVEGFLDVVVRSAKGDYGWLRSRAEVDELQARVADLEAARDRGSFEGPLADYASGQRADDGLYIDRFSDEWEFLTGEERLGYIDAAVRGQIDRNWPGARITDREISEITLELDNRGGDADFLIERVLERELEFAELPPSKAQEYDDIPWDETGPVPQDAAPGRGGAERPGQDGGAEGGGAAGQGRNVEQTGAGEQALIDGVEPVSPTDQAMAQRNAEARRRADNAPPMDTGLFDLGQRDQMDWLDNPASAKADPVMSQQVETIRGELEADPELAARKVAIQDADGNVRTVSLADWSGDLDQWERAIARLDLCGKGPS
jgi:hypothetical protein